MEDEEEATGEEAMEEEAMEEEAMEEVVMEEEAMEEVVMEEGGEGHLVRPRREHALELEHQRQRPDELMPHVRQPRQRGGAARGEHLVRRGQGGRVARRGGVRGKVRGCSKARGRWQGEAACWRGKARACGRGAP